MGTSRITAIGLVGAGILALAFADIARAELLASDSFDYTLGETYSVPANGSANVTNTGWTGGTGFSPNGWGVGGLGGSASSNSTVTVVDGLSFGSLSTNGNAMQVTANSSSNMAYLSCAITGSASTGSTLWTSFLFQSSQASNHSWTEFGTAQFASTDRTFRTFPYSSGNLAVSDGGSNTYTTSGSTLANGNTYFVIGKWTNLGVAGTGTAWGLNLSQFNTISADGVITEAELNTNALIQVSGVMAAKTLSSGNYMHLISYIASGTTKTSVFDEVRVGTTLTDVAPIPEPGMSTLLAAGLLGLLVYAWRKRQ